VTERITDIVETDSAYEMAINESDRMTPRREGACLFVDSMFPSEFRNQVGRNQVADRVENGELASGWGLTWCFMFLFNHRDLPVAEFATAVSANISAATDRQDLNEGSLISAKER